MLLLDEKQILENSLNNDVNLTFNQFIKFNEIGLDEIKVDNFFHNLQNNIPIYMDETMIGYFGYSGSLKKQKQRLTDLIETNFIEYKDQLYYMYDNKDYTKYLENLEKTVDIKGIYPPVPIGRGTSTTKHTLIMPKLFKSMLMMCQTIRGKRFRKAFIEMYDAFMLYFKFQCLYENLSIKEEYNKLFSKEYTRRQSIIELDRTLAKKYKIGCVYFIQEELSKNIKIGWCWNLQRRLSCLQVSNSQKLFVIKSELCQFPYSREKELHKEYEIYHIRGEWYSDFQN
jgi:hypothetical protein